MVRKKCSFQEVKMFKEQRQAEVLFHWVNVYLQRIRSCRAVLIVPLFVVRSQTQRWPRLAEPWRCFSWAIWRTSSLTGHSCPPARTGWTKLATGGSAGKGDTSLVEENSTYRLNLLCSIKSTSVNQQTCTGVYGI